jgi:hypothetical protein
VLYADHETPFYHLGKDENGLYLFTDKIRGAAAIALWSHSKVSVACLIRELG